MGFLKVINVCVSKSYYFTKAQWYLLAWPANPISSQCYFQEKARGSNTGKQVKAAKLSISFFISICGPCGSQQEGWRLQSIFSHPPNNLRRQLKSQLFLQGNFFSNFCHGLVACTVYVAGYRIVPKVLTFTNIICAIKT